MDKKIKLVYILLLTHGNTNRRMIKVQIKGLPYDIDIKDVMEFVGKYKSKPSNSMIHRIP